MAPTVSAQSLNKYVAKEKIVDLPLVTTGELDDKSDTDCIAKVLACAQSAWFLGHLMAKMA